MAQTFVGTELPCYRFVAIETDESGYRSVAAIVEYTETTLPSAISRFARHMKKNCNGAFDVEIELIREDREYAETRTTKIAQYPLRV